MRIPGYLICVLLGLAANFALAQAPTSLPEYRPDQKVSGVMRSWGSKHMASLMKRWEAGFRTYQPDIYFSDFLKGTATAQFGLHENVADLALSGREIWPYEYYGIYRRSLMYPVEIAVATGSYDAPHKSYALTVFVHKDNPLTKMSLKQLDGVFGAQRTGGWQKLSWHTEVARSDKENILTWGQLGLTGEWADKPIHPYGPPGVYPGGISFFQTRVMGGADTWAEELREYDDPSQMIEALSKDRYGICLHRDVLPECAGKANCPGRKRWRPLRRTHQDKRGAANLSARAPGLHLFRARFSQWYAEGSQGRSESKGVSPLCPQPTGAGGGGTRGRLSAADDRYRSRAAEKAGLIDGFVYP